MSAALALARSENFLVGSILLVSGIILSGFIVGSVFSVNTSVIIILMTTVVPAFALSIVLLPLLAIVLIAIVVMITIGVLPLMANISASTELNIFIGLGIIEGIFILIAWFRERTESLQQDEIGILRNRLEERIEERTRFSRIAAEIGQELISTSSIETLLSQSVNLINARMGFTFTGFYLANETRHELFLKTAQGFDADRLVREGKRIPYGPPTMLGWVAENKQQHLITRLTEDPLQLEAELLPGNQSELVMPILGGDILLGVLDFQSARTTAFDNEIIVVLQMLASQIATSIQNVHQFEAEKGSIQEVAEIYLAGFKVAQAKTEIDIYQIMQELFLRVPYVAIYLTPEGNELKAAAKTELQLPGGQKLPESIAISIDEIGSYLGSDIFIGEGSRLSSLPYNLVRSLQQLQVFSVAVLPIKCAESLAAVLLIGTQAKEPLNISSMQPYNNLAKQVTVSLDRIRDFQATTHRITEMGTINSQLQTVAQLAGDISNSSHIEEVNNAIQSVFQQTHIGAILLLAEKNNFRVVTSVDPNQSGGILGLPEWLNLSPKEVSEQLANKTLVAEVSKLSSFHYAQFHPELNKFIEGETSKLPLLQSALLKIIEQALFQTVAFVP
ncbi:MAG TPA: GAF domain-containing protein, partial [Leptolinea sp.]